MTGTPYWPKKAVQSTAMASPWKAYTLLNMVEMAFRAYDPCLGCATHSLPGRIPLQVSIRDAQGNAVRVLRSEDSGR